MAPFPSVFRSCAANANNIISTDLSIAVTSAKISFSVQYALQWEILCAILTATILSWL